MTETASARKSFSRAGFALVAVAAVTVGAQLLLQLLVSLGAERGLPFASAVWMDWVVTFAPLYLLGMPAGLWVLRALPRQKTEKSAPGAASFFLLLLMCFPLMYFGSLLGTGLSLLLSEGSAENALLDYAYETGPLKTLIMVVLAPLLEEYFFRRRLLDPLARYGEKNAMIFSALCFGLFHMNLYQFFYAFALGLLFAYVYLRTGRLRYSVLMHMVINFLGSVVAPALAGGLDLNALASMDTAALQAALRPMLLFLGYYILYMGCVAAGLVLLILKFKDRRFAPASCELAPGKAASATYGNAGMLVFILMCLAGISINLY